MADIIFLGGLEIETIIGIYDWERTTKQTIVLDIEMAWDIEKAAMTDDIVYALDYKKVYERVVAFAEASQFFLVETLVVEIVHILRDEFAIPWVKITLNKKGAIQGAREVGIMVERGQK